MDMLLVDYTRRLLTLARISMMSELSVEKVVSVWPPKCYLITVRFITVTYRIKGPVKIFPCIDVGDIKILRAHAVIIGYSE